MHILFWLIKDSCWMLELKWLGAIMIIPTLFLAIYIVIKTTGNVDFYINMAVFFWISANSFWMVMEFFNHNQHKNLASIPFALGFIFVALFFYKTRAKKEIHP